MKRTSCELHSNPDDTLDRNTIWCNTSGSDISPLGNCLQGSGHSIAGLDGDFHSAGEESSSAGEIGIAILYGRVADARETGLGPGRLYFLSFGGFVVLATRMRPVGGWLGDKIGGARLLSLVFFGVVPFALLLVWPAIFPFSVGALGCAALMGLGSGAVFKLVPQYFPKDTGTVTGLVSAMGGLGGFFPLLLAVGSRNLQSFDSALVIYTFSVVFAVWGVVYHYNVWLEKPPTRLYWDRGWELMRKRPISSFFKVGETATTHLLAQNFIQASWRGRRGNTLPALPGTVRLQIAHRRPASHSSASGLRLHHARTGRPLAGPVSRLQTKDALHSAVENQGKKHSWLRRRHRRRN